VGWHCGVVAGIVSTVVHSERWSGGVTVTVRCRVCCSMRVSRVREVSWTGTVASGISRVTHSWIRELTAGSMTAAAGVVDIEDNFGANAEIEEGSGIAGEELSCSGDFGTGEEDELNAVTITRERAVIVDNPNDAEIFDDGDDFRGVLRSERDRAGIGQVFKEDDL